MSKTKKKVDSEREKVEARERESEEEYNTRRSNARLNM